MQEYDIPCFSEKNSGILFLLITFTPCTFEKEIG